MDKSSETRDTKPIDQDAAIEASLSARRIVCPICGHENLLEAVLCVRCQNVLQPETKRIGEQDVEEKSNWGTSEIEKKLYLHVRHVNETLELAIDQDAEFILGRVDPTTGQKPAVDLSDYGAADRGVSRQHAKLILKDGALKIADLDSANFTYLNGQKLVPNQARILRDGDEIRLGRLVIGIQFAEEMRSI
jgi:hypothetical protein